MADYENPKNYLTTLQAAKWLNVSKSFLDKARHGGRGPKALLFGRAVRYRMDDLNAWAESQQEDRSRQLVPHE